VPSGRAPTAPPTARAYKASSRPSYRGAYTGAAAGAYALAVRQLTPGGLREQCATGMLERDAALRSERQRIEHLEALASVQAGRLAAAGDRATVGATNTGSPA
jgi:hypothetical protein